MHVETHNIFPQLWGVASPFQYTYLRCITANSLVVENFVEAVPIFKPSRDVAQWTLLGLDAATLCEVWRTTYLAEYHGLDTDEYLEDS